MKHYTGKYPETIHFSYIMFETKSRMISSKPLTTKVKTTNNDGHVSNYTTVLSSTLIL